MIEKVVTIQNETGLHARPAAALVQFVKKYSEESIEIVVDGKIADAKSIFNVMSLGISKGTEVILRVTGSEEENTIKEVADFIESLTD